ncbi:hypothetical protein SKAU_G00362470 [Synaphobranchus kaupii]|uniref:Uncharacterized protein n=1 Tax=Synaphobranchus kaupii TaxID=118154 RepID=A0A9Q1EIK7_SYNKA|nr:hypothetical protein SKAU_G00362470 [Synaphobranchus kaupii]
MILSLISANLKPQETLASARLPASAPSWGEIYTAIYQQKHCAKLLRPLPTTPEHTLQTKKTGKRLGRAGSLLRFTSEAWGQVSAVETLELGVGYTLLKQTQTLLSVLKWPLPSPNTNTAVCASSRAKWAQIVPHKPLAAGD